MESSITTKKKIRTQYIYTVIIMIVYVIMAVVFFGAGQEENDFDKRLEYRLVNGKYATCYSSYDTNRSLEGTDFLEGPQFEPYKEFISYYENYIKFVIYDEYDDYFNTNEHMEQKDSYIKTMEGIKDASKYTENYPHYDYLYEYVSENK